MSATNFQTRLAPVASVDQSARTVELVWSTGAGVRRVDPYTGREFLEVLSMDPAHVRLDRLNSGAAPLLKNHDRTVLDSQIGVVERAWLVGNEGRALVKFSDRAEVAGLWGDVVAGIVRNVSVGYAVHRWDISEGADGVQVQTAVDWEPAEISLVPVPADAGAGTRAASSTDAHAAGVAAERTRVQEITEACTAANMPELAGTFIARGLPAEAVRNECLRALAERSAANTIVRGPRVEFGEYAVSDSTNFRSAVVDGLLLRSGIRPKNVHPAAKDFSRTSVADLAALCLSRAGISTGRNMTAQDLISRAMTTSDFPVILANIGGKSLGIGYNEAPNSFSAWTKEREVSDFKEQTLAKLSEAPGLSEVPEHAEYKPGFLGEYSENFAVSTYGRILSLTRQAMINDDLSALTELSMAFGAAARRLEADLVYSKLTSNPTLKDNVALFHTNHKNLAASAAALSTASLGAARAAMRLQKGPNGSYLDIIPAFLIVPPQLETVALQLVANETDPTTANQTQNLEWVRKLTVVVDPRLADSSATAWYLAANPSTIDTIGRAYVSGEARPYYETRNGFETDTIDLKVRIDVCAFVGDYRGLYKNPGA